MMRKLSLLRLTALAAAYTATRVDAADGFVVAVLFCTHYQNESVQKARVNLGSDFAVGERKTPCINAEILGKGLPGIGEKFQ